jgi:hypothetical protein
VSRARATLARSLAVLVLGAALWPVPNATPIARAEGAYEARFFDELGRRAYARGRYEEALEAFLDAERAAHASANLYNAALAASLAGRDDTSFALLEQYLASTDPSEPRRADARRRRDALAASLALVEIDSTPPGARIEVDREELGTFGATPRGLVLEPGRHEVTLSLADHEPVRREVVAEVGRPARLSLTLPRSTGTVRVTTEPPGAAIEAHCADGLVVWIEPGEEAVLPVGATWLEASAPGHDRARLDLVVRRGERLERALELARAAPPTGRVLVSSGGVRARVRVDGADLAETPAVLTLPVGAHRLELVSPGHPRVQRDVEVRGDRPVVIDVRPDGAHPTVR